MYDPIYPVHVCIYNPIYSVRVIRIPYMKRVRVCVCVGVCMSYTHIRKLPHYRDSENRLLNKDPMYPHVFPNPIYPTHISVYVHKYLTAYCDSENRSLNEELCGNVKQKKVKV